MVNKNLKLKGNEGQSFEQLLPKLGHNARNFEPKYADNTTSRVVCDHDDDSRKYHSFLDDLHRQGSFNDVRKFI